MIERYVLMLSFTVHTWPQESEASAAASGTNTKLAKDNRSSGDNAKGVRLSLP